MKKLAIALAAAVLLAGSCEFVTYNGSSTGNGHRVVCKGEVVEENFDTTPFDKIVVNGKANLKYAPCDTCGITVSANQEVFDYLDFSIEDGTLYLQTEDKVQVVADHYDIYVASPSLTSVVVNGAADASIVAIQADDDLNIQVNGAGDCELQNISVPSLCFTVNGAADLDATDLNVGSLSVTVNGAGDVVASGKAEKASFSISGAGSIDASKLACEDIRTSTSGMASIKLPK